MQTEVYMLLLQSSGTVFQNIRTCPSFPKKQIQRGSKTNLFQQAYDLCEPGVFNSGLKILSVKQKIAFY